MTIEVYEAEVQPLISASVSRRFAGETRLQNDYVYDRSAPNIGTSIGIDSPTESGGGTLGCWLRITHAENEAVVATTCHHVAFSGLEDRVGPLPPLARPSTNGEQLSTTVTMTTPSQADYRASVAHLDGLFQCAKDEDSLRTANSFHAMIRDFPRSIGECHLGSGLTRTCPTRHCRLDWAVIECGHRDNNNRQFSFYDNHGIVPCNDLPHPINEHLDQISFTEANSPPGVVVKLGRTTGATVGELNGCRTITRVYASTTVESVEETVVPSHITQLFAWLGDSGAAVFGKDSRRYMLWGLLGPIHHKPQHLDAAQVVYVTPLEAIIDDIRSQLAQMHPNRQYKVELL